MTTYKNMAAALADPTSHAAHTMQKFDAAAADRDRIIAEWMTLGYTREEAFKAALFGFRK